MNNAEFWLLAFCVMALGGGAAAGVAAGAAPEFAVTLNAADYAQGNMPKAGTRAELNTADPPAAPATCYSATWKLPCKKDGSYAIWLVGGGSGHFGKSTYSWSLDGGDFKPASNNALITTATNLQAFNDRLIELAQSVELKAGEHRLTLRVEQGQRATFSLAQVALAPAWKPKEAEMPKQIALKTGDRVCVIGDSITTGGYYIQYAAAAFEKVFPQAEVRFFNCDNPGDTTNNAVGRLDPDVLAMKPTWVVIALGVNDVRDVSLWHYLWNLNAMITRIKAAGAKVMLLTPTVYDEDPTKAWKDPAAYAVEMLNNDAVRYHNRALETMTAEIEALARKQGALVADVHRPLKALIEQRAAGKHALDLLPDRLHPSPEGHTVMAMAVLKAFGMSNDQIARSGLAIPPPIRAVFGD